MLHAKVVLKLVHLSRGKYVCRIFTINWHDGHLGHEIRDHFIYTFYLTLTPFQRVSTLNLVLIVQQVP